MRWGSNRYVRRPSSDFISGPLPAVSMRFDGDYFLSIGAK